jgi:hypothetical protein
MDSVPAEQWLLQSRVPICNVAFPGRWSESSCLTVRTPHSVIGWSVTSGSRRSRFAPRTRRPRSLRSPALGALPQICAPNGSWQRRRWQTHGARSPPRPFATFGCRRAGTALGSRVGAAVQCPRFNRADCLRWAVAASRTDRDCVRGTRSVPCTALPLELVPITGRSVYSAAKGNTCLNSPPLPARSVTGGSACVDSARRPSRRPRPRPQPRRRHRTDTGPSACAVAMWRRPRHPHRHRHRRPLPRSRRRGQWDTARSCCAGSASARRSTNGDRSRRGGRFERGALKQTGEVRGDTAVVLARRRRPGS